MAVRKICKPKGCRGSPRCEHPWWFDVMHDGRRWRMTVDEFAIARGDRTGHVEAGRRARVGAEIPGRAHGRTRPAHDSADQPRRAGS